MSNWKVRSAFDRGPLFDSLIEHRLRRFFPDPFFFDDPEAAARCDQALPIFQWVFGEKSLSLFFLAPHQLHLGKFFSDMIHRWLLPGRRIDAPFLFSADIEMFGGRLYVLVEMVVRLGAEVDREMVERNLHILETEVRLGMVSIYHASRILEVRPGGTKGVQEKISALIQRKPDEIDYDIFGEMQHFLVLSREEFKTPRSAHHLSRLIALFYLFRKSIRRQLELSPDKRHLQCKIGPVTLDLPWGMKRVVAIVVALNTLKPNELFEERHLVRAVQNSLPALQPIGESFFAHEGVEDGIHALYLEVEKKDGSPLTSAEMSTLRQALPEEVRRSIETAVRPVFLPRNEEEVMRNILSLAGQLRFVRDLPQVILTFLEQTGSTLAFQVILVRVALPAAPSLSDLFRAKETPLAFIPDRVKRVGMVRKKYPKEAFVFEVRLPSDRFLRDDYTVDLFRARQEVVEQLQSIVGEVRDYNGGMIAKQLELLKLVKDRLGAVGRTEEQLDTLFHALYPIEMRSILDPEPIVQLFLLWQKLLADPAKEIESFEDARAVYMMSRKELPEVSLQTAEMELLVARPSTPEETFIGYVLFSEDQTRRESFLGSFCNAARS